MILIDKTNNEINNKDLTLSVILNTGSFYYSLFDTTSGRVKHLFGQDFVNDRDELLLNPVIDNFLLTESLNQSGLEEIKIGVNSKYFTLVPKEIYLEDEKSVYFNNIAYLTKRDKIISLPLDDIDAFFLFAVDEYLYNRILTKWPNAQIYHASYPILLKHIEQSKGQPDNNMFLHIHDNKAYCSIFKNKQLHFFNSFSFANSDDFIYQVTLFYKNHDLDRSQDSVWISGQLTNDSIIVQDLMKYIYKIDFITFEGAADFESLDSSRPGHYYYDLFAVSSCG